MEEGFMNIVGIDPGNTGAIALLSPINEVLRIWDMPILQDGKRKRINAALLAEIFRDIMSLCDFIPPRVFLEKVGVRPQEGAVGAFAFGRGVGILEGVIAANRCRITEVAPNIWKAQMKLTGANKAASRAEVLRRYPALADKLRRVKDDGRAEAILIALWGRKLMQREERQGANGA